jgi:hypothetical protein
MSIEVAAFIMVFGAFCLGCAMGNINRAIKEKEQRTAQLIKEKNNGMESH